MGDSASMVVYGYQNTTPIQMDEMLLIAKAVERGIDKALLVGDMPFMSYQPSIELAIKNAGRFIKEGHMDAIKLEGGIEYIKQISAIITAGIPVMGHIGLKPQSVLIESGYKVQGKTSVASLKIYQDASVVRINGAQGFLNYKLRKNRHVYFVLSKGKIFLDKTEINERDGVYINGLNEINFDFEKTTELILVDMPINN